MKSDLYVTGGLLPRAVIAQMGVAVASLHFDADNNKHTDEHRLAARVLLLALFNVLRGHGDDMRDGNKDSRRMHYVALAQALTEYRYDENDHSGTFTPVVLFRLRWMLRDCGFRLRVRTTFGTEWMANESLIVADSPPKDAAA